MTAIRPGRTRPAVAPADCWFVLAPSESVGRALRACRVAGLPLVVFRTVAGQAVVDRATGLDEVDDLSQPGRIKKGARPPVRR